MKLSSESNLRFHLNEESLGTWKSNRLLLAKNSRLLGNASWRTSCQWFYLILFTSRFQLAYRRLKLCYTHARVINLSKHLALHRVISNLRKSPSHNLNAKRCLLTVHDTVMSRLLIKFLARIRDQESARKTWLDEFCPIVFHSYSAKIHYCFVHWY